MLCESLSFVRVCQYMLSHYQISEDGDATTAVIFYTYYFTNYLFNYSRKLWI